MAVESSAQADLLLDKKIESLSDSSKVASVEDINVLSDNNGLKDLLTTMDNDKPKDLDSDKLREMILDKIRTADPETRNNIIKKISQLNAVNPSNKSFSQISEKKRESLLKKLYEKKNQLSIKRKPKTVIENIKKNFFEKIQSLQKEPAKSQEDPLNTLPPNPNNIDTSKDKK